MRALAVALLLLLPALAHAGEILDRVRKNDVVRCSAPPEVPGFAMPEGRTGYNGFDVELCRAIAAAVLGDPSKSQFFPLPTAPRIGALKDGTIDVITRDQPITMSRSLDPLMQPAGVSVYGGIGFMVRSQTTIVSVEALDNTNLCVRRDPETQGVIRQAMALRGYTIRFTEFDSFAETMRGLFAGRCDAAVGPVFDLAAARSRTDSPAFWRIGVTYFTIEAYGPVVLRSDPQWADLVRWTLNALVAAENLNVSKLNIGDAMESRDRAVRRLLGLDANPGDLLGLPANWVVNLVRGVGNYGELFERNLGSGSSLGLARGPNDMWFRGGLRTAPPIP